MEMGRVVDATRAALTLETRQLGSLVQGVPGCIINQLCNFASFLKVHRALTAKIDPSLRWSYSELPLRC